MNSLRYNLSDFALCVVLIYSSTPVWGLKGHIVVVFFSMIFSASLSTHRLTKVARVLIQMVDWVVKPLLCMVLSALLATLLLRFSPFSFFLPYQCAILQVCVTPPFYAGFLFLCGSLGREDIRWVYFLTGYRPTAASVRANAD